MKTNLTLGTADIAVLLVLAVLFVLAIRLVFGFFHEKKDDRKK